MRIRVREKLSALSNITDFWPSPRRPSRLIDPGCAGPPAQAVAVLSLGAAALVRRLDDCVADDLARTLAPTEKPLASEVDMFRRDCGRFLGRGPDRSLLGRPKGRPRPFELLRWRVDGAESLGGTLASGPAVTAWGVDEMQVFADLPGPRTVEPLLGRHALARLGIARWRAGWRAGRILVERGPDRRVGERPGRPDVAPLVERHRVGAVERLPR